MGTSKASCSATGAPPSAEKALPNADLPGGSAFETLVLSQQAYVARLAHRLLAWDADVADVVQDVFLAAYRHWPAFRRDAKVTTWLTSITLNACRSHRRRLWLRLRWPTGGGESAEPVWLTGPEQTRERVAAVQNAVRALPQRYREVIVLRYLEGWSIDEIAAVLGRSRAAVDGQLSRGRTLLRVPLREWMDE
jgi:RNA polymerase sigma-70 factor (ECF subfamily)